MSIQANCPACGASYNLNDLLKGKTVRCKQCEETFVVGANSKKKAAREEGVQTEARRSPSRRRRDEDEHGERNRPVSRRRRDEDDDEDDLEPAGRTSSGGSGKGLLIVGGVAGLLFLIVCGGLVSWFWYARDKVRNTLDEEAQRAQQEPQQQNQNPPPPNFPSINFPPPNFLPMNFPPQPPQAPPLTSVADALVDLKSTDNGRRTRAAEYLAAAPMDKQRQDEVAKALDPLLKDSDRNVKDAAFKAINVWGTVDNVPTLITLANNDAFTPWDNASRRRAMYALAKLKDERGAEPIARHLPNFFDRADAVKALQNMGPVAEKEVAKYLDHEDGGVRDAARNLLKGYGAKNDVYITQCVVDAKSTNAARRANAAEFLAQTPIDEARHAEVAKALDPLLSDTDGNAKNAAIKALGVWATSDNVPGLIAVVSDNNFFAKDVRHVAMDDLAKLKDERAAAPIAKYLTSFWDKEAADKALVDMGPAAEKGVLNCVGDQNPAMRIEACNILKSIGTKGTSLKLLQLHALKDTDRNARAAALAATQAISQRP